MAHDLLLFLVLFAAGMLVLVFIGILWMTSIWEKLAIQMREKLAHRALSNHGVKFL